MRVLIVEDEIIAASYLKEMVLEVGYEVVGTVGTGKGAIELAHAKKPDLILMDIMLKDAISGVDAAVEIQVHHKDMMIVFLTAYSDEGMIETAIEANAAGYFLKPYNRDEIVANLKILSSKKIKKETVVIEERIDNNLIKLINNYAYHLTYKQLYYNQKEVYLTKRELQIIDYFCDHKHRVLDFDTIIYAIWQSNKPQQTLRSLIHRIREKTCQELIINVNKMGYKIGIRD